MLIDWACLCVSVASSLWKVTFKFKLLQQMSVTKNDWQLTQSHTDKKRVEKLKHKYILVIILTQFLLCADLFNICFILTNLFEM